MPTERRLPAPPKHSPIDPSTKVIEIQWWRWFHLIAKWLPKIETYEVTLDPASVAANTTAEQTFTVTDLSTLDIVYVNAPALPTGLGIVNARVSATSTLALTFCNITASAIDPSSGTYTIVSIRL